MIDAIAEGRLDATLAVVISNRADAATTSAVARPPTAKGTANAIVAASAAPPDVPSKYGSAIEFRSSP